MFAASSAGDRDTAADATWVIRDRGTAAGCHVGNPGLRCRRGCHVGNPGSRHRRGVPRGYSVDKSRGDAAG